MRGKLQKALLALLPLFVIACKNSGTADVPVLKWYVFNEPSGAFEEAARRCSEKFSGAFRIATALLPADADQQREQLVRRLAARDKDIDIIGMDVIWTAEFAEAGWILPWTGEMAGRARRDRLASALETATYEGQLWGAPFTTNIQLLWYRTDRIEKPPQTWNEMIELAEALGEAGTIQVQGERYEGLTVFFNSLLASAGGSILDPTGRAVALDYEPTHRALKVMKRLAASPAASPSLSTTRESETRLAFETGNSTFMVNYTYVLTSAQTNAPEVAAHMGWARWPRVVEGKSSRVTIGGLNLGIGAYSLYPNKAFQAAACIASKENQRLIAVRGGLPPTREGLYNDPAIQKVFPFAEVLRATLRDAALRPQTPLYNDVSLAISHTLHPMRSIDPAADVERLRKAVDRALHSEGLL